MFLWSKYPLKLGLAYLKKLYDDNKNKIKTWNCNQKTYTGWDLALRYYNGWGCTGADINYVEKINGIRQEISSRNGLQGLENSLPTTSTSEQTPLSEGEAIT